MKKSTYNFNCVLYNCTQHALTPAQKADLRDSFTAVTNFRNESELQLSETSLKIENESLFSRLSSIQQNDNLDELSLELRQNISNFCLDKENDVDVVMLVLPIGSPAFMWMFSREFLKIDTGCVVLIPLFSFSERVVVETTLADGSVEKKSLFQHKSWIRG